MPLRWATRPARMKVQLEKTFPMPASADVAWALLQDIEAVGRLHARRQDHRARRRAALQGHGGGEVRPGQHGRFAARSRSWRSNPRASTLRLVGKGTDSTGGSGASMDLDGAHRGGRCARSCKLVGHQRGVDERQGRRLRRTHDGLGGRAGAQAVRRQLRGPGAGAAGADARRRLPPRCHRRAAAPAAELNGLALAWAASRMAAFAVCRKSA